MMVLSRYRAISFVTGENVVLEDLSVTGENIVLEDRLVVLEDRLLPDTLTKTESSVSCINVYSDDSLTQNKSYL